MRIKTSELTGPALDWAVRHANLGHPPPKEMFGPDYYTKHWHKSQGFFYREGSPLIARMRSLVASKLGDEVDVPKELL
jgi:hypothetical protein